MEYCAVGRQSPIYHEQYEKLLPTTTTAGRVPTTATAPTTMAAKPELAAKEYVTCRGV